MAPSRTLVTQHFSSFFVAREKKNDVCVFSFVLNHGYLLDCSFGLLLVHQLFFILEEKANKHAEYYATDQHSRHVSQTWV